MAFDPTRIQFSARNFFLGARRCFEQRNLPDGKFEMPLQAAVVCLAFGVELGLKSLLASEQKKATGHKLLALFNKLSTELQEVIAANLSLSLHDTRQKVGAISSVFEDWRYVYEKEELTLDLEFLRSFAIIIEGLLSKTPNSPNANPL